MLIKEIMTKSVITVNEEDSVIEVAQLLSKNKLHAAPVLKGTILSGIVTESDFFTKGSVNLYLPSYIEMMKSGAMMRKLSSEEKENMEKLLETKVKDIMTFPCAVINQNSDIEGLMKIIKEKNFKSVPVVDDDGELAGIVTLYDIIHLVEVS